MTRFSHDTLQQLYLALEEYRAAPRSSDRSLKAAFAEMSREAHATLLGPEQMLVAVKAAWAMAVGPEDPAAPKWRMLLDPLITQCIETYYGNA